MNLRGSNERIPKRVFINNPFRICLICCLWHSALLSASAATFYISPNGNDSASGLAPAQAWRTVRKVNQTVYSPGDTILFEGGTTFKGPLIFDKKDHGTPAAPIVIGSYRLAEAGRAKISAGRGTGVDVYNASGIHLRDLIIVGNGATRNSQSGVMVLSTRNGGIRNIRMENLEIFGFGENGISIGTWRTNTGCKDVTITRCTAHDNLDAGIFTWGPWGSGLYAHRDVHVSDCLTYGMKGGSGIILSSVDGGIVERCVAHDNGVECSGASGIWAWDSTNILLQFNESYRNRSIEEDGDGFDLDGGVTNSAMQYNYSHDNDGAGFLLAQYPSAPQRMKNLTVRHNITEHDCCKLNYGAIHVWNSEDPAWISDVHIYHNMIYLASPAGKTPVALPDLFHAVLKAIGIRTDSPNQRCAITVSSPTKAVSIHSNVVAYRDRGLFGSPSCRRAVFSWSGFRCERDRGHSS